MFGKKFAFGVNYFSHKLWCDFDEKSIERDFAMLSGAGIRYIRLFPIWKEFQPIKELDKFAGRHFAVIYEDGTPLDNSPEGVAGVLPIMMNRLEAVMNLCKKYSLKAELTLFCCAVNGERTVPSYLENRNIFTDPTALMWEQRFIKYIVERFKDHVALGGYCIGNEYSSVKNINGNVAAQYSWTAIVCNAIRAIDQDHPIISGLSFLTTESVNPENSAFWQLHYHAESVDMLTVHPNKIFRFGDKANTMRAIISTAAVNNMLENIGNKKCFVEDASVNSYKSGSITENVKGSLLSCYLHGCYGYFFGSDFKEDSSIKEMQKTITALSKIDIPRHSSHAVCVMPINLRKTQYLATNVMCLMAQNDIGVSYCCATSELPESKLYMVPLTEENCRLSKNSVEQLINKVQKGATVYISLSSGSVKGLNRLFGEELINRSQPARNLIVNINGSELATDSYYRFIDNKTEGEILARFSDGTPAVVLFSMGRGKVILSLFSPEMQMAKSNHKVYSLVLKNAGIKPYVYTDNIFVGAMEHIIDSKRSIISLINYSDKEQKYTVGAAFAYHVRRILYGSLDGILKSNDAVIFEVEKY